MCAAHSAHLTVADLLTVMNIVKSTDTCSKINLGLPPKRKRNVKLNPRTNSPIIAFPFLCKANCERLVVLAGRWTARLAADTCGCEPSGKSHHSGALRCSSRWPQRPSSQAPVTPPHLHPNQPMTSLSRKWASLPASLMTTLPFLRPVTYLRMVTFLLALLRQLATLNSLSRWRHTLCVRKGFL
jgi:hypothetical protein